MSNRVPRDTHGLPLPIREGWEAAHELGRMFSGHFPFRTFAWNLRQLFHPVLPASQYSCLQALAVWVMLFNTPL